MGRLVQVISRPGEYRGITLPDGQVHRPGDLVTLSELQWAELPSGWVGVRIVDLGSADDPPIESSGAEITSDAVATTPSLRTLGAGPRQASPGDHSHAGGGGPALGSATPLGPGTAAAGTSTSAGHEDHVHPASPADPAAGTAGLRTLGTGAQQAATGTHAHAANPPLSSATPQPLGVAAAGVATSAARDDHVHLAPASDPPAGTAGLRTLGTASTQAAAGNDSRLSDARNPLSHASTHAAGSSDPITAASIGADAAGAAAAAVAAVPADGPAGTASLRTLGTSSVQAAAGNDSRLTDPRTPGGSAGGSLAGTYPSPTLAAGSVGGTEVASGIKDPAAGTAGLRTLGTGAQQAAAGNDARLADSRAPSGTAGGSLAGTYPSPTLAAGSVGGTEVASAIKDPSAGTAGLRTLGTGAAQAAAGNDSRLSDSRTPGGSASGSLAGSYPSPTIAAGAIGGAEISSAIKDAVAGTASLRTLGTGATQAAVGTLALSPYTAMANSQANGVAGNGTTDDTAALQALIDACPKGGKVILPPGTYKVTAPLLMKPAVTVEGYFSPRWPYAAPARVMIQPASSFSGRAVFLFLTASKLLSEFGVNLGSGVDNYAGAVVGLSVDGNNLATSGQVVDAFRIEGDVQNVRLERLDVYHTTGSTLHTLDDASGNAGRGHEYYTIRGDGDAHAFWFESGFTDCVMFDCLARGATTRTSSTGDGFNISDGAESHMISCRAVFRNGNGIVVQGIGQTGGVQITNFSTDRNQKCGMRILRRGFGNNVYTNVRLHRDGINGRQSGASTVRDSTYAALEIIGSSSSLPTSPVSIDGLSISVSDTDGSAGSKAPDVGIRLHWTSMVDIRGVVGAVVTAVDDLGSHQTAPLLPELTVIGDRTSKTYTPALRTGSGASTSYVDTGLATKVTKGSLFLNAKDYGAVGDGSTNDTAAINTALAAITSAGGGVLFFPAGTYMTDGGHALPAYSHILGCEPSSRYWGYNSTTTPPTSCALKIRSGSAQTAMLAPGSSYTAGSIRDISLLGNNVGSIHGLVLANPSGVENNMIVDNVAIIGFGGDGIRGRLFASRLNNVFIGGCHGWGANCTGSTSWTDVWFVGLIITGCLSGALNIDSTGSSGEVHFAECRFERSGWNPASPTTPVTTSAPGIHLRGNLLNASFVGCSTDANSGHGIDVDVASGRSLHHIQFVGCRLNRDGFGDMTTIGEFAAIRVRGITGNLVDRVSFVGCTTTEGKADDGGGNPSYLHPKYGLWVEKVTYLTFQGGSISEGHAVPYYGGAAGWNGASIYRPALSLPGSAGQLVIPSWDNAAGRPTLVLPGQAGFRADRGLEWNDGTNWHEASSRSPFFTQPGRWHATGNVFSTLATLGVGTLRLVPYYIDRPVTLTSIAVEVTTAGEAGSLFRIGVYADDGTGLPGVLTVDAGTVAGDGATGMRTVTGLTVGLTRGLYWFGGAVQNVVTTQPTMRTATSTPLLMALNTTTPTSLSSQGCGYSTPSATGALPSPAGTPTSISIAPRVAFLVS